MLRAPALRLSQASLEFPTQKRRALVGGTGHFTNPSSPPTPIPSPPALSHLHTHRCRGKAGWSRGHWGLRSSTICCFELRGSQGLGLGDLPMPAPRSPSGLRVGPQEMNRRPHHGEAALSLSGPQHPGSAPSLGQAVALWLLWPPSPSTWVCAGPSWAGWLQSKKQSFAAADESRWAWVAGTDLRLGAPFQAGRRPWSC